MRAQPHQVHRHVRSAARTLSLAPVQQHRHWRFRRDALHVAPYISVQHQVADYQHMQLAEATFKQIQNSLQVRYHQGVRSLNRPFACAPADGRQEVEQHSRRVARQKQCIAINLLSHSRRRLSGLAGCGSPGVAGRGSSHAKRRRQSFAYPFMNLLHRHRGEALLPLRNAGLKTASPAVRSVVDDLMLLAIWKPHRGFVSGRKDCHAGSLHGCGKMHWPAVMADE